MYFRLTLLTVLSAQGKNKIEADNFIVIKEKVSMDILRKPAAVFS